MMRPSLLLAVVALLAVSCHRPQSDTVKQASGKADPLLGKWVCLADNVNAEPDTTVEFRADGTAVFKPGKEKPVTLRFRREPGRAWLSRRVSDPERLQAPEYAPWTGPGVEVILFANPETGKFEDTGGMVLTLDPEQKILYNLLTQLWCRPGDEARVRKLSGMDARAEAAKERNTELKAWRPEKDLTAKWRVTWSVDMAEGDTAVGDLDGDGEAEIVASDPTGFAVLDQRGQVVRKAKLGDETERTLVVGRQDGAGLVCLFGRWGKAVRAYDPEGRLRWTFGATAGPGIDGVATVELDEHNTGFVIGYNGGGIEFLGPDGKSRWRADVATNVWCVAGAKLHKGLPEFAVCVGPDGALAFDSQGKQVHTYGPEDAGAVGSADLDSDGIDEVLTLGTTQVSGGRVTAFSAGGRRKWSEDASAVDVMFIEGRPFVCGEFGGRRLLGVACGMTIRFFEPDGTLLGDFVTRDGILGVGTLPRKGKPDALLVRVRTQLRCYEWRS